jgi:hypothetical protein
MFKEFLKNMLLYFLLGLFLGTFLGGYGTYTINSWQMYKSAKMLVIMYFDPVRQVDRIFDLKERL